jgi:hypothetical protein
MCLNAKSNTHTEDVGVDSARGYESECSYPRRTPILSDTRTEKKSEVRMELSAEPIVG